MERPPTLWKWYHFYFVLALFDVVVILASLFLHHRTLVSYEVALGQLGQVDSKKEWLSTLRLAVTELNAPGNDVFATRQVADERQRAEEVRATIEVSLLRQDEYGIDLSGFIEDINLMSVAQERIFDLFLRIEEQGADVAAEQPLLAQASVHMVEMDRAQARALDRLTRTDRRLSANQEKLYREYGDQLERQNLWERLFLACIVLILLGILWYGRKLHYTHQFLEEHERRVASERQQRLASIGELCSAVAHGIRNPLASITSSAQMALRYQPEDDRLRQKIDEILTAADRLNNRSTRLLDFASLPSRQFDRFELSPRIQGVVQDVQPRLDALSMTLNVEIVDPGLRVYGDPELIEQAILEVVANAIDHTGESGTITIRCHIADDMPDHVTIDIRDSGPGIPERLTDQVFELFFSSKPGGGGFGLALVKRAVEHHRGRVFALNAAEGGACIRLVLPMSVSRDGSAAR